MSAPPIYGAPRRDRASWVGGTLFVLLALAAGIFVVGFYLPEREAAQTQAKALADVSALNEQLKKQLKETQARLDAMTTERNQLSAERAKALQEKENALKALESLKGELSASLEVELTSGDIGITRRGRELVVDVSDKILFDTGRAEVNERGKEVLKSVAAALGKLEGRVIQVGGHTDNAPVISPDTLQRFPTNWELSTARATNVVRFLQESGKLPGERLAAAGFAEYRPTASNTSDAGRQKNRRIEIVLVPPPSATE